MDIPIVCPVCRGSLTLQGGSYRCEKNHTFDRARAGYTNLLLGHTAGQHGDNADMIAARRDFLSGGWYAPLKDALCRAVGEAMPEGGVLLDAGCGECYYTDAVMAALQGRGCRGIGIDISRDALKCGGKRESVKNGSLSLFAAGVYDMPVSDASADVVTNLFAPLAAEEYRRILRDGGALVMAIPAERHLWELKEILYDAPRENEVQDFALEGFSLTSRETVTARFTLTDPRDIMRLFSMTPYFYRTPRAGSERLAAMNSLTVTAAFYLLSYRRMPCTAHP